MSDEKKKMPVNPLMRDAIKSCRSHLGNAALFSLGLNVLFLAPTLYMLQVYDRVVPTQGLLTLLLLTILLVFALACLSALDQLRMRILTRSGIRLDKLLGGQILSRLYAKAAGGGRTNAYTTAMREFDTFKGVLSGQAILAVFDMPWGLIYLGLCFLLHPYLGLVCLIGGLGLALLTYLNERATYTKLHQSNDSLMQAYARQESTTQSADIIRSLGMREAMVSTQIHDRQEAMKSSLEATIEGSRYVTLSKFLRMLMQSTAIGIGAWLAIDNKISGGAIFASSLLMARALSPMEQIISSWRSLSKGYASFQYINDLFDKVDLEGNLTSLPAPKATLEVENLTIVNHEQRSYFLNGVGFSLSAGEMLGVLGQSGAGKTTLARALVGADGYDYGNIRFDGADRRDWDSERLARHIGFLPQNTALFAGSIRDNICRFQSQLDGNLERVDQMVIAAAKMAGAHDQILRLQRGYNTVLGPSGLGLSAGQAQRIGLARAMYGNPFLLVLDEPNSHLDQQGEADLNEALQKFCAQGGALIVIAHRVAILAKADKILTLQNGRVVFFGPKDVWVDQQRQIRESNSKQVPVNS